MIISYQWLMNYLPEPLPVDELSTILTSIGLEVEAVETAEAVKGSLQGLVIGQVLHCEKHPNADKLSITTVDTGNSAPLQIVCGAPNVAAGQRVVVAPVGSRVYPVSGEPFEIKKAKIRGTESQGMICAEDEIGLGSSHAGIMVLPGDAPVGQPARGYFRIPEPDFAIHIGLTPNRSDAMSHMGVARDVCAWLSHHRGGSYELVTPVVTLPAKTANNPIRVQIDAPEACLRYAGISLKGLKVSPSPDWLVRRLEAIGLRPINNVVDVTNFVLHEYGQPLHAFDASRISDGTIQVRFLPEGSLFTTLDEKQRMLSGSDLMICDTQGGLCIAGVFGGQNSGVTEDTTEVFLESAWFDPGHIRRTSLRHGLRTDAATHFEKGVDINSVVPALVRAASLILELAGGEIASDIVDVYPKHIEQTRVSVSYDYIRRLSGKAYGNDAVRSILQSLGFSILHEHEMGLQLLVPTNKPDVSQPADIVEEILRIDGLDQIEIPSRMQLTLQPARRTDFQLREQLANQLCGLGFQEIVTNSIVNSNYYPGREDLVRMINSLSSELDVMRPSLLECGLEVAGYNCNRRNNDLQLFEFGKVYRTEQDKYREEIQLALWVTGQVRPVHWDRKAEPANLYYLKGVIESLLRRSGISGASLKHEEGRAVWRHRREVLCTAEQVSIEKLDAFDLKQEVWFGLIHWEAWIKAAGTTTVRYQEIPRFPSVVRDLAIVLDRSVSYEQVQEVTGALKLQTLQQYDLFDVFESDKLGAGKKSYALSYTFQATDRTLTDKEIDQNMQDLMQAYKSKLQAQIRE